jgi:biofilm protein TabA
MRAGSGWIPRMALYGSFASVRAQAPSVAGFSAAFAYVDELLRAGSAVQSRVLSIAAGDTQKIGLAEGVFVVEQAFETRLRADGFFESHRNYIDVQAVLEGEELMEVADVSRMTVRQPYHVDRDIIVYEDNTEASLLRVFAGQVAIFFPADVHMPTLRIRADPVLVRKAVVKIPVG